MKRLTTIMVLLIAFEVLVGNVVPAVALPRQPDRTPTTPAINPRANGSIRPLAAAMANYPNGTIDSSEPSGQSPPGTGSMAGYALRYVNDFVDGSLPTGWNVFTGVPGGEPGGQFAATHVIFSNGLLLLNTTRDANYGNKWVTGGICQCGLARTYGAYFVRSRITGAGPNEAQLLWPANAWPPEIDFSETGASASSTSSTLHFGSNNHMTHLHLSIDMTQWHTWGVVWTANSVIYTVDGREWGRNTNRRNIPRSPMTLDFEQRTSCHPAKDCPTSPVSMMVDWVAEYSPL